MQQDWLSVRVFASNIIFIALNFSLVTTQKYYCLQFTWNALKIKWEYLFFSYFVLDVLISDLTEADIYIGFTGQKDVHTHIHTHTHTHTCVRTVETEC
jgi:hypothetical protein